MRHNDRQALASPHPVRSRSTIGRLYCFLPSGFGHHGRSRWTPERRKGTSMSRHTFVVALVLIGALAGGCALSTRSIADIQSYPGRYEGRSVTVEGTVTSSFGGPFVP